MQPCYWEAQIHIIGKQMGTGRTKPYACFCEASRITKNEIIVSQNQEIFVVKLMGESEMTCRASVFEIVAAMLAQSLGVNCVEPAIVTLHPDIDVQSYCDRAVDVNIEHFGSKYISSHFIYSPEKFLEKEMLDQALRIYIFDMLTQNPDRRKGNPNLFTDGTNLVMYDHDSAFSFLFDLFNTHEAWQFMHLPFATDHILFNY